MKTTHTIEITYYKYDCREYCNSEKVCSPNTDEMSCGRYVPSKFVDEKGRIVIGSPCKHLKTTEVRKQFSVQNYEFEKSDYFNEQGFLKAGKFFVDLADVDSLRIDGKLVWNGFEEPCDEPEEKA